MRVLAAVIVAIPSLAHASPTTPSTVGAGAGMEQSSSTSADAANSLDVFARIGLTRRLGVQAELGRLSTDNAIDSGVRTFTLAFTYDLIDHGQWIPILIGGAGFDWGSMDGASESATHVEIGGAIEYRATDGLTLGLDLRMGDRSVDTQSPIVPETGTVGPAFVPDDDGDPDVTLADGAYVRGRLYAAIHF